MTFLDTPIEDRVSAGIDWLNENGPAGWWDRIDFDTLNLEDGDECVLGQVFAAAAAEAGSVNGYAYVVDHVFRADGINLWAGDMTGPLGFLTIWTEGAALTNAWISAIDKIQVEVYA